MESPVLMSKEQVKEFAAETNNSVLWHCIKMYEKGNCSWEQAMQIAAIALAKNHDICTKQLIDAKSRQVTPKFIYSDPTS